MGPTPFRAATIDQSQPGPPHLCDGPIRAPPPNSNSLFFFFLSFLFLSFFLIASSFRPSFCPFLIFLFSFFFFLKFFFIFSFYFIILFFLILHLLSFFHFGIRLAFTHSLNTPSFILLFYFFYSSGLHRGLAQSFLFIQSTSSRTISIPSFPLSAIAFVTLLPLPLLLLLYYYHHHRFAPPISYLSIEITSIVHDIDLYQTPISAAIRQPISPTHPLSASLPLS